MSDTKRYADLAALVNDSLGPNTGVPLGRALDYVAAKEMLEQIVEGELIVVPHQALTLVPKGESSDGQPAPEQEDHS